MHQDGTVTINWFRMNVPSLVLIGGAVWWLSGNTAEVQARVDKLNHDVMNVSEQVTPITTTLYRIGIIEGQLSEANRKNDKLSEAVNNLTTSVELLRQQLQSITDKSNAATVYPK